MRALLFMQKFVATCPAALLLCFATSVPFPAPSSHCSIVKAAQCVGSAAHLLVAAG